MIFSRRAVLAGLPAAAGLGLSTVRCAEAAQASFAATDPDWLSFKQRFISPEGRVIDTGNNNISHSEGQSYGMLFALTFDDRATFDRVNQWTAANLKRPTDALHIWRWLPNRKDHTPDQNNATDGDLVIAMALARATDRWGAPEYRASAVAIAADIRNKLIANAGSRLALLPGLNGFVGKAALTVNLSYYNFVAFRELGAIDASPLWEVLSLDGLALVQAARFGRWLLPPDWLSVPKNAGALGIAAGWPPLCSYDAIRVPLNLVWAQALSPDIAASFTNYWTTAASYQPAWANLRTNTVSEYAAAGGMVAVRAITTAASPQLGLPVLPSVAECVDYYSSALTILARIAWVESHGG
ncbi:MAG TPA: glycosyl hydrolase family 8 [Acidisoma sp.]|uniref:glycosyl hydrolase family 8 n=1 Tax=Acidisoma sp. TaxID=1872115 RepID=UPI002CF9EA61|nr:glycosyl hydrolase family 8 [Acidisoma sp.]HTI01972.1 glycosyl hydrolase family 8 [Acidisoma sp.]